MALKRRPLSALTASLAAWLLATAAFAQGYINPPVYATGTILVQPGTTVNTTVVNAYNPNNLNVLSNGAITTWNITFPFPPFDGEIISIGCPKGSVGTINLSAHSPTTVASGGPTSCTTGSGILAQYQYSANYDIWLLLNFSPGGSGGGSGITALTGDVTASGPGSAAATLATVNPNVGTFGSATSVGQYTVNAKGLITGASNVPIVLPVSQLATQAANTILANTSGSSAAPSAQTINGGVSCTNALTYVNGTGFGCNSGAGVGTVTNVATDATLTGGPCTTTCTLGINGPVSAAKGGTGVASPTAHTIGINEGASAQNNSGTGTLGQALMSNGASADQTFNSGPWRLLNTLTASSSATLSDTTSLTSSYSEYEIVFERLVPSVTSNTAQFLVHTGGAFPATSYVAGGTSFNSSAVVAITSTIAIPLSQSTGVTNAEPGLNGIIHVSQPSQTSGPKAFYGHFTSPCGAPPCALDTNGWYSGTNAAIDGFQFNFTVGGANIVSGTIKVYGRL